MNLATQRLLKLHKLFKPADENGSDTGGSDAGGDGLDGLDSGGVGDDDAAGDGSGGEDAGTFDGAGTEGEDDEVVVSIGEEAPAAEDEEQARAPEWVRDLRKQNREKDRKLREQEAEIQRLKGSSAPATVVVLGTKPTLENCDYNEQKFETELEAWHNRKRELDDQQRAKEDGERKARDAWQVKLNDYSKAKTALKVKDFDDAEDSVRESLSITQQGIILNGAENPAVMIYALGKNPKKAKELAAITDPVKFTFAVAKLETQLKVTPRKTAPVPERTVRGGGAGNSAVDSTLQKLMEEAAKTGDRTKVAAYHRNKSRQAA